MSDPFLIPSLISGGMSAVGNIFQGLMNQQSQRETNAMQIDLANTAVQRRQKDLAAAGINPLLAGSQGGAQTPTLQAPQMQGLNTAIDQITPNAIQRQSAQMQQQQMQIGQTQAETELIKQQRETAIADAALKNSGAQKNVADTQYTQTQNKWYGPQAQQHMNLEAQQQQTAKAQAENLAAQTNTQDAMRSPQVEKIKAETTNIAAQTAKTQTETEINAQLEKNAAAIYGAQADKAKLEVAKLATEYKQFDPREQSTRVEKTALENEILKSELGQSLIKLELAKKYGDYQAITNANDNFFKIIAGAGYVAGRGKNTQQEQQPKTAMTLQEPETNTPPPARGGKR